MPLRGVWTQFDLVFFSSPIWTRLTGHMCGLAVGPPVSANPFPSQSIPSQQVKKERSILALAHLVESTVLHGGEGPFDSEIRNIF